MDSELAGYNVILEIGKGSFATVYKAADRASGRNVAVKTIKKERLSQKLFDNLQSEIDILKSLQHRHITRLINIVRADTHIYLIMEYCAGGDLTNYIKKRGRVDGLEYAPAPGAQLQFYPHPPTGGLDELVVRSFLRQLGGSARSPFPFSSTHRPLCPPQPVHSSSCARRTSYTETSSHRLVLVLCTASPTHSPTRTSSSPPPLHPNSPKVIPSVCPSSRSPTLALPAPSQTPCLQRPSAAHRTSLSCLSHTHICTHTTRLYMAPEILRYEKYDAKADLWSVGAVLYEMSVGKPPFRALNHVDLIRKIDNSKGIKFPDEDPNPSQQQQQSPPTSVPSDIKKLIRALLKRNPAERASFDDFFTSTALARSKFPRPAPPPLALSDPQQQQQQQQPSDEQDIPPPPPPTVPPIHRTIPPEVLDPTAVILASKINFRRREVGLPEKEDLDMFALPLLSRPLTCLDMPCSNKPGPSRPLPHRRSLAKPLSPEGSIIPGETEEDGLLRREYVLVGDTRAVELNRAVDGQSLSLHRWPDVHQHTEMNAARRTPLSDPPLSTRRPPDENEDEIETDELPPPTPTTFPPRPHPMPLPPSTTTTTTTGFIPIIPLPIPLSSSPSRTASSALNRALSLASKKLFGVAGKSTEVQPSKDAGSGSPSSASPLRRATVHTAPTTTAPHAVEKDGSGDNDPQEDALLASLEALAQKTDVLTRWADEMYEYVKAVPQSAFFSTRKTTTTHYILTSWALLQSRSLIRQNSRNGRGRASDTHSAGGTRTSRPSTTR